MVDARQFFPSWWKISLLTLFSICMVVSDQIMCSPVIRLDATSKIQSDRGSLDEQSPANTTTTAVNAQSRNRRQSTSTQCLRIGDDDLSMSEGGDVSAVPLCSEDDDSSRIAMSSPRVGLVRILFRNGCLGVSDGNTVKGYNISDRDTIAVDDPALWCETTDADSLFQYRYFSPSMDSCTDDESPLYLTVTSDKTVVVSNSGLSYTQFRKFCYDQCI